MSTAPPLPADADAPTVDGSPDDGTAFLKVACDCGRTLKVPPRLAGRTLKCPFCRRALETGEASDDGSDLTGGTRSGGRTGSGG